MFECCDLYVGYRDNIPGTHRELQYRYSLWLFPGCSDQSRYKYQCLDNWEDLLYRSVLLSGHSLASRSFSLWSASLRLGRDFLGQNRSSQGRLPLWVVETLVGPGWRSPLGDLRVNHKQSAESVISITKDILLFFFRPNLAKPHVYMLPVVDKMYLKDKTAHHGVLDLYPGLDLQTYIICDAVYDMN